MTYEIYDGATLLTLAVPQVYVIGTNANAAILNTWPSILTVPAALPAPATHLKIRCSQNCRVSLFSFDLLSAQAIGAYPAGLPTALYLNAGQLYEIDFPTVMIWYYRDTVDGILTVHAFA